jgi:hypothetical protein
METNFGQLYQLVPSGLTDDGYELRPGVSLLLYTRKTMLTGQ